MVIIPHPDIPLDKRDISRLESYMFLLPVFDMFLEVCFVLALRYP